MAYTKNAALRYRVLDRCFSNIGKQYFIDDLIEACTHALQAFNGEEAYVSRRTIFDDIRFMESEEGWSIPLERIKSGRKIYYRYKEASYSIYNQPLNPSEQDQLKSALEFVTRFHGLPQFEWLEETLIRFEIKTNEQAVIGFDENPYLKGLEYLRPIFNAIINQSVLAIRYKDFVHPKAFDWIIHPYYLKQYNNRWFLLGYNEEKNKATWMLAIDRIVKIQPLNKQYTANISIDWQEHFEDIIGVTKLEGKKAEKIELWFHPATAPYIISKPIHGTQKVIKKDEEGLFITIEIIPNYEFYQQILFYGNRVKVLSPLSIQQKIIDLLQTSLQLYYLESRK